MLTVSELNQIKNYLAKYGKKDSQLDLIDNLTINDYIAVVQGTENKRVKFKTILAKLLEEFIDNVEEASSAIDEEPTKDSKKFVRSGGVYNEIRKSEIIDTNQIKDKAVTANKIDSEAISTEKIKNKAVTEIKLSSEIKEKIDRAGNVKDGQSAYEIAVEQGFEGTIEEWLVSLKGEKGEKGNLLFPTMEFEPLTGELVIIGDDIEDNFDFDVTTGELIFNL